MKTVTVTRSIQAPLNQVFLTISDIRNFANAIPQITQVEFLTQQQMGVGTQFRETRVEERGKEVTSDLEVVEYVENERIRLASNADGTRWDTVFTLSDEGERITLTAKMTDKPKTMVARLLNRFIYDSVEQLESDMDAIKAFCEKP